MSKYLKFNNFRIEKHVITRFLMVVSLFFFHHVFADGTKQVSPGNGSGAATANGTAYLVNPTGAAGSYPGSAVNSKLKVTVQNFNIESILSGFMPRTFNNSATTLVTNAYVRILNPSGVEVYKRLIPTTAGLPGFISTYGQAWNGPNVSGGYSPFTYQPIVNGEFTIELYRSDDLGVTAVTATADGNVTFPYFDISVATGAGATTSVINGRLWSRNWSFITTNIIDTNFPNVVTSSFEGDFYVFTNDGFKALVDFQNGFKPFGFQLVMNFEGVASTGNFAADNKSRNGIFTAPNTITYPALPTGYRLFLTTPDPVAFQNGTVGSPAITGNIYGCPGAYFIPYYLDRTGDVAVTLDLNGIPGYQPGTEDVVLQAFNVPVGNNIMAWNGLNGLGGTPPVNFSAGVSVLLLQGRVNLPMIDAELNTNGLSAISIFPNLGNRPLFWDDSGITAFGTAGNANANITVGGTFTPNLRSGIVGPSHAWDGSNPTLATPAPLTANQGSNTTTLEDDYGNARIINTWFYGSQVESALRTLSLPGCDNDFDGIPNNIDLDDDNDGILDTVENNGLTDPLGYYNGSAIPNYINPQSPGFVDTNFDGVDDRYDLDKDGIINQFDTDVDGDGCADAIEGSEYVTAVQIHSLTLPVGDANYSYRGQIKVLANGITTGTPSQIVSTVSGANGVPLLVNPAASNTGNTLGVADNTDGTSDVGQGLGISQNASFNGCTDSDQDGIPDADDLDDDNDGILDSVECPGVNTVVNGTFDIGFNTGNWASSGGWVISGGVASNVTDSAVNQTLSQTLTNLDKAQGGIVSLTFTVGAQDGNNASGSSASLDILLNGVVYATLNNSTVRALGTNNITINTQNGATTTFVSYSTFPQSGYNVQTFTLDIFYSGPASAVLGFRMNSAFDDWSVDNVSILIRACDTDNDGIPNDLDLDSDGDGCPDAIEGSESVTYKMINPMTATSNPGQIGVLANGTTAGTPVQVISTFAAARGVPQLLNNGANNYNILNNTNNTAGVVDNTDGSADVGQGIGTSLNSTLQDLECRCYKPANTATAGLPTNQGITALGRAGASNGNWPMKITGAYTALDAKTKGLVLNRLTTAQINGLAPVRGMMAYDTDLNCLKIYDGTVWACYTKQTCDQY
ncbi:hypothetical protein [Chryseobacterium turcicum]|uniref:Uncharacterized protein n=1 Tax=Chryseobacterium turcicum TaxID=2898076 RepID=A0A9Q3YU56_9FLAO|nr:hypothetical protein [Chryseobacterium turcicum]MCD1115976.1 hypothetical protein [Chryseobacterium turcicum]